VHCLPNTKWQKLNESTPLAAQCRSGCNIKNIQTHTWSQLRWISTMEGTVNIVILYIVFNMNSFPGHWGRDTKNCLIEPTQEWSEKPAVHRVAVFICPLSLHIKIHDYYICPEENINPSFYRRGRGPGTGAEGRRPGAGGRRGTGTSWMQFRGMLAILCLQLSVTFIKSPSIRPWSLTTHSVHTHTHNTNTSNIHK